VDPGLRSGRHRIDEAAGALSGEEMREVAVGVTAMIVFAGILLLSYLSMGEAGRARSGYLVHANFNRVDGLVAGDEVQVGGVPVGKVEAMALAENFRVRVSLRIDDDLPLPSDTSAAIHTDGLFGGKFVVLEPGGEESTLADGGVVTFTQDSLIVSELLDLVIAEGRAQRALTTRDSR
jgi:phospholipid/cholesterol/gamma-HCH transport system substrate-binding protein